MVSRRSKLLNDEVLRMLISEARELDQTDQLQNWIASYIPLLVAEIRDLRTELEEWKRSAELACECPPASCDCPGCSMARESSMVPR